MAISVSAARRTGIALVLFVVANVVGGVVGSEMTRPLEHHSWIAEAKDDQLQAYRAPCTDVAIIGSSVGLMGLSPQRLLEQLPGVASAYNASLGGSFAAMDAAWYRRFVEPRLHPRTVLHVLALPSLSTDRDGARELWDKWTRARASGDGPVAALDRFASRLLPIVRYRSRLADPEEWIALGGGTLPQDRLPDEQLQLMDAFGFMGRDERGDPDGIEGRLEQIERLLRDGGRLIEQEQLDALSSLLADQLAAGAEPVLVLAPVSTTFRPALVRDPADFERYRDAVRDVASAAGVRLIDASDLAIDVLDFWDGVHVNLAGAQQFTDHVAQELLATGVRTCER